MRPSGNQGFKKQPSYARSVGSASIADEEVYMDPSPSAPMEPVQPPPSRPPSIRGRKQQAPSMIDTSLSEDNLDRPYDLTPVGLENTGEGPTRTASSRFTIDPWELPKVEHEQTTAPVPPGSPGGSEVYTDDSDNMQQEEYVIDTEGQQRSIFLMPEDIHPNMENKEEEIAQLRLLAGKLSADWRAPDFMAPALARRIRDFQFAQEKRRKKYGDERPWGILGLYDHLSAIRIDVEWAEEAAVRRSNGEPYLSWAEFDESKKGGSNRPYFTYILLFVCTVIMIASIGVNGWEVEPLDENPMIGPSADTLIKMGAKDTYRIVNENGAWRLLTSTVLHAGLVHYFINMLALWFVGAAIETSHGWVAAMVIFIISAVGGTILSAICLPDYITVGASGGIFGFIGACLADIIMNWKLLFCDFVTENGKKHRHAIIVLVLVFDIALNSIIGLTPYVDNFTHLGGMAYGFLCGLSTIERLSSDFFGMEEGWLTQAKHFLVRFFGLILSVVSIITTLVILLQSDGETTPCPNCTWLSCVPFPPWANSEDKWWYCDDCGRVTANIMTQPHLHLELHCPGGWNAMVNLTAAELNRDELEKDLPTYCREFCPDTEETN